MFKSERREKQSKKRHARRVHSGFAPQYNAMEKRERERRLREEGRFVRSQKEAIDGVAPVRL
jgi:hypothetical protein